MNFNNFRKKISSRYNLDSDDFDSLLQSCLNISVSNFLLKKKISFIEYLKCRRKILKLSRGVPLAYVLGKVFFYEDYFFVNKNVLIARSETEQLVSYIIDNNLIKPKNKILDIGSGSGNISISLKKYFKESSFISIDNSYKAIKIAKKNSLNILNKSSGVKFIVQDFFKNDFLSEKPFDMIISNPPYIAYSEKNVMDKSVLKYEPENALFSGEDGLDFIRQISFRLTELLQPGGTLMLEIGYNQGRRVIEIFQNKFKKVELLKDYSKINRFFYGIGFIE